MQRKLSWLLLISVWTAGCGGGDESGETGGGTISPAASVTSNDGKATLAIPEGALPSGVSANDITLTAVSELEAFSEPVGPDATYVAGYDMEPEGLVFAAPATLTVTTPIAPGLILAALVSEEAEPAFLPATLLFDANIATPDGYSVPVSHFSRHTTISVYKGLKGSTTSPLEPTHPFGPTSMSVQVAFTLEGAHEPEVRNLSKTGKRFASRVDWAVSEWTLSGAFETEHLLPENPQAPVPSQTTAAPLVDLTQHFRCESDGQMLARYFAFVSVPGKATWTRLDDALPPRISDAELSFYDASDESEEDCEALSGDAIGDFVDSVQANTPTFTGPSIDMTGFNAFRMVLDQLRADTIFNHSAYECGTTTPDGVQTVCPDGVLPMPPGEVFVFQTSLAAAPGSDTSHRHIYSVVLESDGSPANDWAFVPPFDWDLFQGADRWYQLTAALGTGAWSIDVTQVNAQQNTAPSPSAVRAIIVGSSITWFVPKAELPAAVPKYRITAYGDDGNYSESDRGADVSGANPAEPLIGVD